MGFKIHRSKNRSWSLQEQIKFLLRKFENSRPHVIVLISHEEKDDFSVISKKFFLFTKVYVRYTAP